MIDWTKSMQQTFEFYEVNPSTWRNSRQLEHIIGCSIERNEGDETLEHATIDCEQTLEECYVRVYLVCTQDKETESIPLGTFLVQTPSSSFDGKVSESSMDAYSPLLELKDNKPPYGFAVMRYSNVMESVTDLTRENARAPVIGAVSDVTVMADFISDFDNDDWLIFLSDLAANAHFKFGLDEMGRIMFVPDKKLSAMQPVWEYNDNNSSILFPDISLDRDLYGIPNVVEVLVSNEHGFKFSRAENKDTNSPISIINRGREVVHRVSNPNDLVEPTQDEIDEYARNLLETMSISEYTLNYSHGYCPVRVGDCVMLNYKRAGLHNIKARVISQSIDCKTGCKVTEKAKFTTKLWESIA